MFIKLFTLTVSWAIAFRITFTTFIHDFRFHLTNTTNALEDLFLLVTSCLRWATSISFLNLYGDRQRLFVTIKTTKQWVHFDFVTVQFRHLWKILRRRVCFEPEAWPWLTACFICKISERNAASWFECSNWIFLSSVRRGLSWFSSIWILFTFKSFLCCASFSLRLLLLTTASEINWRWSSEMFTF